MTEEETKTGNILIAIFMGWKIDNSFPDKERVYRLGNSIEMDSTFKFHSSWDWIIPVVQNIEKNHNGEVSIYHSCCDIGLYPEGFDVSNTIIMVHYPEAQTKLEAVWIAIVKFIKLHNK